jgi:hypothetical protein
MAVYRLWILSGAVFAGVALLICSPWLLERWRRLRPVVRCLVLSVLAHIGLLCLLTGWRRPDLPSHRPSRVRLVVSGNPYWTLPDETVESEAITPPATVDSPVDPPADPEPLAPVPSPAPSQLPEPVPPLSEDTPQANTAPEADGNLSPAEVESVAPSDAPRGPEPAPQLDPPLTASAGDGPMAVAQAPAPASLGNPTDLTVRETRDAASPLYRARLAEDKLAWVEQTGGDAQTEAAVQLALAWMARVQQADGRWDPAQFGGGSARDEPGADRFQAGLRAETGITGLALLAFLASGSTTQSGSYQATVARGVDFLVSQQATDGSLAGRHAGHVEAMYCHAMALLALSEAYGMTGDRRLEEPVRRAVAFTRSMQHPSTGGWRYRRGDLGDTSQLGWQLMSLFSASQSGIAVDEGVFRRAGVFLGHVSSGRSGGLASYQFGQPSSRPMTAEALLCRLVLGRCDEHQAREATAYLLEELPGGGGETNFYYWYYGSLALYQIQGTAWERWNAALKSVLVGSQRRSGDLAGSWDPRCRWGPYGGRVYSTALATLSLEVYYRYLPFTNRLAHWTARQPQFR